MGAGRLVKERKKSIRGHFYTYKKSAKGRKKKRSKGQSGLNKTDKEQSKSAKEAWLIFSSTNDFRAREIIKLYSRRMQIEQNFRDEKNGRFGFGLRASKSRSTGRILVLSLLATLSTIVMWLLGYHAENKGLHLKYQANSIKSRRVISYLTLAKNVLRHSPLILRRTVLSTVLNHLSRTYYRKAETRDIGDNDYHGGDGPVSVTTSKPGVNPLFEAMIEAGVQAGYPRTDDLNGYQQEGFGPMDRTVTPQGRRASTARGYLDQAKSRPNLTIRTHAMTDHIIFDGKRAVDVEWLEGDSTIPTRATANKEVLLCAGAIASPQILQRSGVGNAELLAEFDIPLVHELPGVGENLQDHLEMYLQYECKEPVSLYPALQWWNQPKIGAEWLFGGTGVGASNHFEAGGFIRSREEFAWPNIQYHFLPVAINYNGSNAVKEHGFQCHVGSMRSPSRGHVRIKSRDPHQHPAILFNYMSHEQDWQEFRDAIRITREIMHQPALDQYRGREISPGVECQTDEQLDEFVRNHAETAFHPCGTCKMGYDEMSVVDGEGRVHGLEGLRVVDASIMPQIITGNLNATTIMIGEKIADMIRGQEALPRSTAGYFVANGMPVRAKK